MGSYINSSCETALQNRHLFLVFLLGFLLYEPQVCSEAQIPFLGISLAMWVLETASWLLQISEVCGSP